MMFPGVNAVAGLHDVPGVNDVAGLHDDFRGECCRLHDVPGVNAVDYMMFPG